MSEQNFSQNENNYVEEQQTVKKQPVRIPLWVFICTCLILVVAAVMITVALSKSKEEPESTGTPGVSVDEVGIAYDLELLQKLFETYSFEDLDEEAIRAEVLKAYVRATGDKYAEYYTEEEYAALTADMGGESQGIGINIINSTVTISGGEYKALKVINVIKDSPAEKSDMHFGDYIIAVGNIAKNDYEYINNLGYDMALTKLQGVSGTNAEFVVYREDGEGGELIDFSITREAFTTSSVMSTVTEFDATVGVVKIIEFDRTTPEQLKTAIEELKASGCTKFVFDLRYNPGGELSSIVSVLSLFLNEGDTVISVKDNSGVESVTKIAPTSDTSVCPIAAEDIGKYRDLNMLVLCNESTASAAELFVANFRDYELATIVGTKTYGKGSMQSYINLAMFGSKGYLKITRHMYYPPSGIGYDGIGIEPHYTVVLSDEAKKLSVYEIMGKSVDNQLTEAVKYFK